MTLPWVGGKGYLWGGSAASPCPAAEDWEKFTDLENIIESLGFDVTLEVDCMNPYCPYQELLNIK